MSDAPSSGKEWVSKTDFVSYLRCPYVFWLTHTGQIKAADAWTSVQARLIAEGRQVHEDVIAGASPLLGVRSLQDVIAVNARVVGLPDEVYRNERLKILGKPDGLDAAGGELLPIESKSHREVTAMDKLELAFYHLLLEPYRTRTVGKPRGYVILRRDLDDELTEVPLDSHHFERVLETVEAVRIARRDGVQPRVHHCSVCLGLMRDRVLRSTRRRKDVSLIFGIGYRYATELEQLGIRTYEDLVSADHEAIAWALRQKPYGISLGVVRTWVAHAMSYIHAGPVVYGRGQLPSLDRVLALDFEYDDVNGAVWLIGACLVNGAHREYMFLWEDTPARERARILQILRDATEPVVTWSGKTAEFTKTRSRIRGIDLPTLLAILERRHHDGFQFMCRNVRLPIPSFSLKDVAAHFRIRRRSPIRDGIEANAVYQRFRRAKGTRRERLRAELQQYNRDDLDCTIKVLQKFEHILSDHTPGQGQLPATGVLPV